MVSRPERAVVVLAARQHGVVSTVQLHAAGLSDSGISRSAAAGRLHRLHRGVYVVGHTALPELALEQAALLACGADGVLSHLSAAALWKIIQPAGGPVDVTVPGRPRRSRPGLRVHRHQLTRAEIRIRQGLPLTSPCRTLVDLATQLGPTGWEAALSEARFLRLIRDGELERAVQNAGSRGGTGRVRDYLNREIGPLITQSEAERRFLRLVRDAGLPAPRTQTWIEGHRVDVVWPEHRLIVELDGIQGHGHRSAFERDRRKDAILIAAGWRILHYTWPQLSTQPLYVIATLSAALARD